MSNVIEITDFHAGELDVYARLSEVQLLNREHPQNALFIAESPKVILRALQAGCIPVSILMQHKELIGGGDAETVLHMCPDIPIYTAPDAVLTQLTGFHLTRGMLCAMRRPKLPTMEEVCCNAHRIAVLENVMNPTNIGAIFRSAAALHMDSVLLTPHSSDPLYRRSIRVSMGTVFQIPWTFISGGESWVDVGIQRLKEMGFRTVAMALRDDSVSIRDLRVSSDEKVAIILGTEGDGLADETIARCDCTVRIPMSHGVDSLNVAAASAVAFYQLSQTDF